jgi:hypothetical protein
MKIVNITNLICNGFLSKKLCINAPTADILKAKQLRKYQDQEGDIPASYSYAFKTVQYELHVLDGKITTISRKLYLEDNIEFLIEGKDKNCFILKTESKIDLFLTFLNSNEIPWEIEKKHTGEKSLGILINKRTLVIYSFEPSEYGFYYLGAYNDDVVNWILK